MVTVRPPYTCRKCESGVLQAAASARLIDGGLPTDATVAQVLISKYADDLPLYRQAQIYARQDIDLDHSTLTTGLAPRTSMVTLFAFRTHMLTPWQSCARIPPISRSDIGPSIP